jgi:hypothetical protein
MAFQASEALAYFADRAVSSCELSESFTESKAIPSHLAKLLIGALVDDAQRPKKAKAKKKSKAEAKRKKALEDDKLIQSYAERREPRLTMPPGCSLIFFESWSCMLMLAPQSRKQERQIYQYVGLWKQRVTVGQQNPRRLLMDIEFAFRLYRQGNKCGLELCTLLTNVFPGKLAEGVRRQPIWDLLEQEHFLILFDPEKVPGTPESECIALVNPETGEFELANYAALKAFCHQRQVQQMF